MQDVKVVPGMESGDGRRGASTSVLRKSEAGR
jgi:hypothetical protein